MQQTQEDPILVSARREALIVFASWAIAMTWSVSYCYSNGYISLVAPAVTRDAGSAANGPSTTDGQPTADGQSTADNARDTVEDARIINARRISGKEFVEVKPASTPDGVPELWIDRGQGMERVQFFMGFPTWIFWGVVLPWWICTIFSLIFGAYLVTDQDLGADTEISDLAPEEEAAHV